MTENFFYVRFCEVGDKVTIPLLVREVLRIEEGDYVRVSISEVIQKKQQQRKEKTREKK